MRYKKAHRRALVGTSRRLPQVETVVVLVVYPRELVQVHRADELSESSRKVM